jgi:hypothetical protein
VIPDPDPRRSLWVNEFASDTQRLHPIVVEYAGYGAVVLAGLLALDTAERNRG